MKYRNGDRVKITTVHTMHEGETGVVVNAYADAESLLVKLDKSGQEIGYFVSEVEIILTPEETEQVNAIASALLDSHRHARWEWKDAVDAAIALHRAGFRRDRNDG